MIDIDLIPRDYRIRQWQTRWLKVAGAVFLSLLALHGLLYTGLSAEVARIQDEIADLQAKQLITTQQRTDLEGLTSKKLEFERQLELLTGLRSGGAAQQMFVTIDRALPPEDIWFVDWRFQRSGVVVEETEATVNTGYFIVVPAGPNAEDAKPWQVQTHMTIRGQSRDHSALSAFVRALFAQPEIEDVHVGRTSLKRSSAIDVVDFDLAIVMNTDVRPN